MKTEGQLILPFAECEYVDVRRCAHILGVSWTTVHRLAATVGVDGLPLIRMVEYRARARKRILYSSIVAFCSRLRERYRIADRRPRLDNPIFRHRDEDLLPFSLSDTIFSDEALAALGYRKTESLVALIDEGRFEAYKLVPDNPWRVSRSSFAAYLESIRDKPSTSRTHIYNGSYKNVDGPRGEIVTAPHVASSHKDAAARA